MKKMPKRSVVRALVLALPLMLIPIPAATAFYDDVHYSLNYYIARVIGFTPEQAYRIANACVSVDYSPLSEPTQLTGGLTDLAWNPHLAVEHLPIGSLIYSIALKYQGSGDKWQEALGDVPAGLESLMANPAFKESFEAQWRFHAFRDLYKFPHSTVDGPPYPTAEQAVQAQAADEAIVAQRELLFKESFELKNLGVFLHFFGDEVPHHGYAIGGGHWVLLPQQWQQSEDWIRGSQGLPVDGWKDWSKWAAYDKRGSIPAGSTSDWLSYRSIDSNMKLVRETAGYMLKFMKQASKGQQQPLVKTPEKVADIVKPVVLGMRSANVAPPALRSMKEVVDTKLLQAGKAGLFDTGDKNYLEQTYGKHAKGPSIEAAHGVINAALKSKGMEEIPHLSEPPDPAKLVTVLKNSGSAGATIVEFDKSHVYGGLRIKIDDPAVFDKRNEKPNKIEVIIRSVPAQKGEKPYEIVKNSTTAFTRESLNGQEVLLDFFELPMGEVDVEVRYYNRLNILMTKQNKRMKLTKKVNEEPIKIAPDDLLSAVVDAFYSLGFKVEMSKKFADSSHTMVDMVTATQGEGALNEPNRPLLTAKAYILPDDAAAKQETAQYAASPHHDYFMDHSFFDIGCAEPANVASKNAFFYPTHPPQPIPGNEGELNFPMGGAQSVFSCGHVSVFFENTIESPQSFDFKATDGDGLARNKMHAEVEIEENKLKPRALAEHQEWLLKIGNAFNSFNVCHVEPRTVAPDETKEPDAAAEGLAAPAPSGGGNSVPSSNPAPAVAPAAPTAPPADTGQPAPPASAQSSDELKKTVVKNIRDVMDSAQLSDAAAANAYASVSFLLASRPQVAAALGKNADPTMNWDAYRALAEKKGRTSFTQHMIFKVKTAMDALGKAEQDALLADIRQALAQAS